MMNIWRLLSKEFVFLVTIACAIAVPISFLLMSDWLERYAYRTDLSVWVFVAAGMSALSITLLIVGFQTLKATTANPVESLRSE